MSLWTCRLPPKAVSEATIDCAVCCKQADKLHQAHSLYNHVFTNTLFACLLISERESQRSDARRRESESETQLRDIHNLSNQLANRNQPIQEYTSQNKADALQRLTADLEACKKRQDKLEKEVEVIITVSTVEYFFARSAVWGSTGGVCGER